MGPAKKLALIKWAMGPSGPMEAKDLHSGRRKRAKWGSGAPTPKNLCQYEPFWGPRCMCTSRFCSCFVHKEPQHHRLCYVQANKLSCGIGRLGAENKIYREPCARVK